MKWTRDIEFKMKRLKNSKSYWERGTLKPTNQGHCPIQENTCEIKKAGHQMLMRMPPPGLGAKLLMREVSFTVAWN